MLSVSFTRQVEEHVDSATDYSGGIKSDNVERRVTTEIIDDVKVISAEGVVIAECFVAFAPRAILEKDLVGF